MNKSNQNIFSNYKLLIFRAQSICNKINSLGFPSIFIVGNQNMDKRIDAINKLKHFKCRILLTTDLTARGIDAENVNLIVNLDIPEDSATYLHRIGRAGRYGSRGIVINIVSEKELKKFQNLIFYVGGKYFSINKLKQKYLENIWNIDDNTFEKILAKQDTLESDFYIKKNIVESINEITKNSISKESSNDIQSNQLQNDKNIKESNKSCINNVVYESTDSIKSIHLHAVLQWKEFYKEEHLHNLKIKISFKPLSLEKLNNNIYFTINLSKMLHQDLCKVEINSIIESLNIEFKRKSTLCNNTSAIEVITKSSDTIINSEENIQKIIDRCKININSNIFEGEEFKILRKLNTNINKKSADEKMYKHTLYQVICLKNKIINEISLLELLLSKNMQKETLSENNFYPSLCIFYHLQKKALVCIHSEIRDEDELSKTYLCAENNLNKDILKMYQEIENCQGTYDLFNKLKLNFYFPYKININKPILNFVTSENEIIEYKEAINYLKSNENMFEIWHKTRYLLSILNSNRKQILCEKVKREATINYDKLIKIVSDIIFDEIDNSSTYSNINFGSENILKLKNIEFDEKISKQTRYIPLITNNISYNNLKQNDFNCCNEMHTEKANDSEEIINDLNFNTYVESQISSNTFNSRNNCSISNMNSESPREFPSTFQSVQNNFIDPYNYLNMYNNNIHHVYCENFNYCYTINSEIEEFFINLRNQIDQIHLQKYYYHMLYQT
jgi:superfamily II DNA/RNA helicase